MKNKRIILIFCLGVGFTLHGGGRGFGSSLGGSLAGSFIGTSVANAASRPQTQVIYQDAPVRRSSCAGHEERIERLREENEQLREQNRKLKRKIERLEEHLEDCERSFNKKQKSTEV